MLVNIKKNQGGYTLVELNMSIAVMGIIMVGIFAVFTSYFVQLTRNDITLQMTTDSQNLLRVVTEELRYGAGVRQTNSIADPNAPGGTWNTSDANFVIITAVPAIDTNDEYIIDPLTAEPYINELVYYKDGDTMLKRTLAHPSAVGNTYITSCPSASATPTCPADKELVDNVNNMTFTLFDQDDASTTDPLLARSIIINLSMQRETFGSDLTLDNSIRTTLRNTF